MLKSRNDRIDNWERQYAINVISSSIPVTDIIITAIVLMLNRSNYKLI